MKNKKLSFTEIVDNFINKHGKDWCNNPSISESVVDTFIDCLKSKLTEQFDYEKVDNLI